VNGNWGGLNPAVTRTPSGCCSRNSVGSCAWRDGVMAKDSLRWVLAPSGRSTADRPRPSLSDLASLDSQVEFRRRSGWTMSKCGLDIGFSANLNSVSLWALTRAWAGGSI
jgi:hypothetical protein